MHWKRKYPEINATSVFPTFLCIFRRKLTVRITELEDTAERERARAANLEKIKTKLTLEIKDLQAEIDNVSPQEKNRCSDSHSLA